MKKILILLLTSFMIFGIVGSPMFAEESDDTVTDTVQVVNEETQEEDLSELPEEPLKEQEEVTIPAEEEIEAVEENPKSESEVESVPAEKEEDGLVTAEIPAKENLSDSLDFSSRRLLIATDNPDVIKADTPVISEYNGLYLAQYESGQAAMADYNYYIDKVEFVEPDLQVVAADGDVLDGPGVDMSENENPLSELSSELDADSSKIRVDNKLIALLDSGTKEDMHVVERVSMLGDKVDDDNGHGNFMLDIITEENIDARVLSIKVLDENGIGNISSVIAGIEYAIEKGADIINLSLSAKATYENSILADYVKKATDKGIKVVGAAGNNNKNVKWFTPGNLEDVIVVGMGYGNDLIKAPSNFGDTVDYLVNASSTSVAAAKVSAVLSLGDGKLEKRLDGNYVVFMKSKVDTEDVVAEQSSGNGQFAGARTVTEYRCAISSYEFDTGEISYRCNDYDGCSDSGIPSDSCGGANMYSCPVTETRYNYGEWQPTTYGIGQCSSREVQALDWAQFLDGAAFNTAIKGINANAKHFKRSATAPTGASTVISNYYSNSEIRAWNDGDTIYWYCPEEKAYMAPNSNSMFNGMRSLESIEFSEMDSSKVTSMREIFRNMPNMRDFDFTTWDMSAVTDAYFMFAETIRDQSKWTSITLGPKWKFLPSMYMVGQVNQASDVKDYIGAKHTWTTDELTTYFDKNNTRVEGKYNYNILGPGTYLRDNSIDHVYIGRGNGLRNAWEIHHPETMFKGYCFSHHIGAPAGYYDRIEATDELLDGSILDNPRRRTTPASDNGSFVEAFLTVLYYGYPNNADNIQGRYGIGDAEFASITHLCIRNYADGTNEAINASNSVGYMYGITGLSENAQRALKELYGKKYSSISDKNLKLYVYLSREGHQNMMGMESMQTERRGGIEIRKYKANGVDPLGGAKFGVYDEQNNLVKELTSDNNGLASICQVDEFNGIPLGTYTVKEISAPNGYIKSNDVFKVTISRNGEIVSVGYKNDEEELSVLSFVNTPDDNTLPNYGGLAINKTSSATGQEVPLATYGVYKADNDELVTTLTTDAYGHAETAATALLTGDYYVKEIEAAYGFALDKEKHPVHINGNETLEILNLTDDEYKGTVQFRVLKKYYRYTADGSQEEIPFESGQQFGFELYRSTSRNETTGKPNLVKVGTAYTDMSGLVTFPELTYRSSDGFEITHAIKEINPGDKYVLDEDASGLDEDGYIWATGEFSVNNEEGKLNGFAVYTDIFDNEYNVPEFKNIRKSQLLSGRIWFDGNLDGIQDDDEPPVEQMKVCLLRKTKAKDADEAEHIDDLTLYPAYTVANKEIACTTTDSTGYYEFDDIDQGSYTVVVEVSDKTLVTTKDAGSDDTKDSDADRLEHYIVVKDIETTPWAQIESFKEYPHNDIGIIINPEKFVKDAEGNDINDKCVDLGDKLYYEVTFENPFTVAKSFIFEDIIPENTTFVSADNGGVYDEATRKITWELDDVPAHEEMVIKFIVETNKAFTHPINEASVTFDNTTLWSNKVENWVPKVILEKIGPEGEEKYFVEGATIEVKDSSGKIVDTWVTDDAEHLIQNLQFGKYVITETDAPDGYVVKRDPIPFELVKWEESVSH